MHPVSETPENQGVQPSVSGKLANVRIPGYLFTLDAGTGIYRYHPESGEPIPHRADKPLWRVDVCAALPETGNRYLGSGMMGGAAR